MAVAGVLGASFGRTARSPPNASLRADVAEWGVVPSAGVVPSGRTRIVVRSVGAQMHQVIGVLGGR